MDVKCPYHDHILTTQETVLYIEGKGYPCVIGLCPQCEIHYINRLSSKSRNIFHINGTKYQYLKRLHAAFPVLDAKSEHALFIPTQKEHGFSDSKTSNTHKEEIISKKKDRHAAERQQKKQTITSETREAAILQIKDRILSGAYKSYHAKSVRFVEKTPSNCPLDGDELLDIKNTCFNIQGRDVKAAAHCCIRCGTAYLLEKRKEDFQKSLLQKHS